MHGMSMSIDDYNWVIEDITSSNFLSASFCFYPLPFTSITFLPPYQKDLAIILS